MRKSKLSVCLVIVSMILTMFGGVLFADTAAAETTIELTELTTSFEGEIVATRAEVARVMGIDSSDSRYASIPEENDVTVSGTIAFDAASKTLTFDAEAVAEYDGVEKTETRNGTVDLTNVSASFEADGVRYDASYDEETGSITATYPIPEGAESGEFEMTSFSFTTMYNGKEVEVTYDFDGTDTVLKMFVDGQLRHTMTNGVVSGTVSGTATGTLNGEDATSEVTATFNNGPIHVEYTLPTEEPTPTTTPTTAPTAAPTTAPTAAPTTVAPTAAPTTVAPTTAPTTAPTATPAPESGVSQFIERLYNVALDRPSDANGKADWLDRVYTQGYTGADLARGFLFSPEFLGKDLSDSDFVDVLYRVFFDRNADAAGKAFWLENLANGASKEDVINGFIDSIEFANLCLRYGIESGSAANPTITVEANGDILDFVTRLYDKCLDRKPDTTGYEYWTSQLANRQISGSVCAYGFFFSDELINKNLSNEDYVTLLYNTLLDRTPDTAGLQNWVAQLDAGASREDVFNGFAGSQEWGALCISYGVIK